MSNNDRDFQALKETALSQLKAKHARRSVVLKDADGQGVKVVDAKRLTKIGSVQLLDQLVPIQKHNAEVDMMEGVHARLTKVEVYPPTVTIRYHHMSVETNALVGDKELPTLPHSVSHAFLSWTEPKRPLSIVHDASGILRPGRLTLILGPPSSGKTTFMKALVGRYRHSSDLKVTGSVTYNGKNFNEFMPERVASYVNQFDTHFGELTVRETIDFAAQCQSSSHMKDLLETVLAREKEAGVTPDPGVDAYMRAIAFGHSNSIAVEAIIRLLGLDTCSDTLVGNQMLRGISGGQRKRLGTGEVGVSQSLVLVADEISTGLDSNTTFNITNSLRAIAHIRRATLLVALLQPSPETYELFDDVILISGGLVCYHGPRESVADIFERFGLACPARKGVADFLQEVTTPSDQQKYWVDNTRAYEYVTASTIRDAYLKHPIALDMENELAAPYRPEPGALDLPTYKYAVSYKTLFLSNLKRTLLLQTRDKLFVYVRVFQICLMSVVVATLFLSTPKTTVSDGNIYSGAAFFSLVYMLIGGLAESHLLTMRLPVFYKQREMMFYPGWCFAVPAFIFRLPFCFVDATLWSCIAYFAVGFDVSSRFFVFWLLMFLTCAWATSLFQAIASVCRTDTIASAVGSFFLLVFIVTGGFVMVKSAIPPWWIGAYWANPWAYLTMSISINEFMGASWDVPNPADPTNPLSLGEQVLAFRDFPTSTRMVWIGVAAGLASTIINVAVFVLATTFMPPRHSKPVMSEEALEELEFAREVAPQRPPPSSVTRDIQLGIRRAASTQSMAASAEEGGAGPRTPGMTPVPSALDLPAVPEDVSFTMAAGDRPVGGRAAPGNGRRSPTDGADARHSSPGNGTDGHHSPAVNGANGRPASPTDSSLAFMKGGEGAAKALESVRSSLPFRPLAMTFKDVSYSVPLPKGMDPGTADVPAQGPHKDALRLLSGINGIFRPGVLTALMGASGAGKTTLMDVLAGRKTGGTVTGEVHVNGYPKVQKTFNRISGYVEQEDIHLPQTTVGEAVRFSAALRLPRGVSAATRAAFVTEMMDLVELDRMDGALVGILGESGLSIQARKRLTIAVELVANPSIIFMDEPTTGLDARAASVVMATVRAVVNTGRTVVCTIHQPSIDIFEAFDELLLLKPGGRCVFAGPVGLESSQLIDYFMATPGVKPIKERYNPANWMLEQTNPHNESLLGVDFSEVFAGSKQARENEKLIEAAHAVAPGMPDLQYADMEVSGAWVQLGHLLRRNFVMYWRAPDYNITRFGVTLLVAFVFGSLAWEQGEARDTTSGVLNIAGLLFASTLFIGVSNCMSVQPIAESQRSVMYRERAAGMYSVAPYSVAQVVVELPYLVVQTLSYSVIVYWMVAFIASASKFFYFVFIFGLTLAYFTAYGQMCLNLMPELALANVFTSFFFGFWNLMCGFLIPASAIPGWWIWCYYINPVSWTLYALIVSQLGDLDDEYIVNFTNQSVPIPVFLVELFDYKYSMLWPSIAIIIAFCVVFNFVSFLSLRILNYQNR
ncbi:hypothetical protein ACKKBF_B11655 [Auxenochlorella protothecoides x Auxenochlorella symbiontica]